MLAGKGRGPRKRQYRALPQSAASASMWAERMKLSSSEGGCSATESSLEIIQQEIQDLPREPRQELDAIGLAVEDFESMSRTVWKLRFWRTWPEWSCPPELLRLLFHPTWVNDRRPRSRAGIGLGEVELPENRPAELLKKLLVACRRWRRTLVAWRAAQAARLPKNA
eukprot:3948721-Pyramimonas_sp.AAC.1